MVLKRVIIGGIHSTLMIRNTSKEIEFSSQVKSTQRQLPAVEPAGTLRRMGGSLTGNGCFVTECFQHQTIKNGKAGDVA